MKILVTGAAGFIGFHLCKRLILEGHCVVGLDNLNHYYDVRLKLDRLQELGINGHEIALGKEVLVSSKSDFRFFKTDLTDDINLFFLFKQEQFDVVFNLAAQAGVRYSTKHPKQYIQSNLVGFANVLEACRQHKIKHLVYASSSSVYGLNKKIPFSTTDEVNQPASLYAATKRSNELMAHTYSHLYNLKITGLRFFTVYGPWGRPDMAYFLFTKAILEEQPIKVFNFGKMSRDFTYVDDVVEGVVRVMNKAANSKLERHEQKVDHKMYNIGSSKPISLLHFIEVIEQTLGKTATKEMLPLQAGDLQTTFADTTPFVRMFDYQPDTPIREGIERYIAWYRDRYL